MPIPKISSRSKITEVDFVVKNITTSYQKSDWSSDLYLTSLFDEMIPLSEKLTASINQVKVESNLETKDIDRDDLTRGVSHLLNGFCYHPSTEISNAARTVSAIFDNYGLDMITESYVVESSLIASLLEKLSEPSIASEVKKIPGFEELVNALKSAQTEFDEAFHSFQEAKATDGIKQSATEIKKEILKTVNNSLVTYLRTMAQVNEAQYGELSRSIGQIIGDTNVAVKKRKK